ncbi:MAG TPA: hypothetical protein VHX44_05840 [Planctomycetota bacterium]|nr:hypothetical protein [Planctomycetota bacterium]
MEALTNYFDRLRILIPARTLGLFLIGGTIAQTIAVATKAGTGLAVMSFIILGICILVNFLGGILTDKKPWHAALISSGALILFSISQPAYGPLGAFGVTNPWVYGSLAFIAAAYALIITSFYRGAEPAVQAAQAARASLQQMA